MFRALDSTEIVKTLERLQTRIAERFPESGLGRVAGELTGVAREAARRNEEIRRPHVPIRLLCVAIVGLVIGLLTYELFQVGTSLGIGSLRDFIEVLEPFLGSLTFLAAFFFFLWTLETRWRRARVLQAIHELRSITHVVDMHQLTKDPDRLARAWQGTESSPRVDLTPRQLGRYLDYCMELLALTSKIAALYVQGIGDPVAVNAVDDIENLATGLSSKIGQKLAILDRLESDGLATEPAPEPNENTPG